ncbi:MAG TPA: hypothetical protein PKD86_11390 [Gemmatales bacterium]|nr:hypothetical protein [Gemmatales bacterium]HMP59946.1 hypothetical protein [Gemmatales bacterium]
MITQLHRLPPTPPPPAPPLRVYVPSAASAEPATGPRARPLRYLAALAFGLVAAVVGSYVLVEALELRFVQPWRLDHHHKVRFFQVEVLDPAIVYLGTSQMLNGVMPAVVAEAAQTAGRPLANVGYNLAVPGAELEISWILARDLLHGVHRPRHLVLGVFPMILAGGQQWAPDFYHRYATLGDVAARAWAGDVPWSQVASVGLRGVENLLQWPFYRFKKPIRDFNWTHLRASHGGTWLPSEAEREPELKDELWAKVQADIEQCDTRALTFHDATPAAELLRRFAALAREREMTLTLVYPPQRTGQPAFEGRCRTWLADFCARQGLTWIDLDVPEFERADFTDPYHLNARGAAQFSRRLGARLAERLVLAR